MSAILESLPSSASGLIGKRLPARVYPWAAPKPEVFRYGIDVCLKDSNATGNVYFARYFEWQGVCRERWFFECVSPDLLSPLGLFVTKDAQQQYIHETFAFQRVEVELSTFAIRQCSFSLRFRFYVDSKLVSTGSQQLCFHNHAKKIARLPESALRKIRLYEEKE